VWCVCVYAIFHLYGRIFLFWLRCLFWRRVEFHSCGSNLTYSMYTDTYAHTHTHINSLICLAGEAFSAGFAFAGAELSFICAEIYIYNLFHAYTRVSIHTNTYITYSMRVHMHVCVYIHMHIYDLSPAWLGRPSRRASALLTLRSV